MRAILSSGYCMRAQILARSLGNGQANGQTKEKFFSYQEGQHHIVSNKQKKKSNGNGKLHGNLIKGARSRPSQAASRQACWERLHLPEKIKITKTKNGKRWSTSSMEAELAGNILEIRDGLGSIVDALLLKSKV